MKVSLIARTLPLINQEQNLKSSFDVFSAHCAGICYMPADFETIVQEPREKTEKRIKLCKENAHHSVFDHNSFTLYIEGVPKAFCMLLNNEKQYTTSEKSGRYTMMATEGREKEIYDKWIGILISKIKAAYGETCPGYFTDFRIKKLAMENARMLLSLFTPSSAFAYTTTYRQINILYSMMQIELAKENSHFFYEKLRPYMAEFCRQIEALGLYDKDLASNPKNRHFSIVSDAPPVEEYFGDVYATHYKSEAVMIADLHRHRTIDYTFHFNLHGEYYVPEIIMDDENLVKEWNADIRERAQFFPIGTLFTVSEMGTFDNFVLKLKERKCTVVQLNVNRNVNVILQKYYAALKAKNHPRADELLPYMKGSRCTFPDFKCSMPCGFAEGINETRRI